MSPSFMPCRLLTILALLCAAVLLGACAASAPKPAAPKLSGGLLVLRLEGRFDAPSALAIDIASAGGDSTFFSGKLQRNVPGLYADYLVALALPARAYRITALRESADAGEPMLLLDVPLTVRDGAPDYLGRLVVKAQAGGGGGGVRIEDQYDEDTLLFRTSLAELRTAAIGRAVLSAQALARATRPASAAGAGAMQLGAIGDAGALLAPTSREPFARFLRLKPPRAFAISDNGAHGFASGPQSVERSLRACADRAKASGCRLFAVDDTLIAQDSCGAVMQAGSTGPNMKAGCKPSIKKQP
ncbi:hypothetical protein [Piscinibacter terrae]|uniref:hypothetical protein n=1 Tax=Piscinibacter terrae TaxID=2496871 RepID=UPI001387378D|nr:hypothetical protein [Albitalea terrae]